jgi:integrase
MNRPRKTDKHLPPCVYQKHGAYWYVRKRKWERIGSTLSEALAEYSRRIEMPIGGMAALVEQVYARHTPKLAAETRKSYRQAANKLAKVFAEFSPQQVRGKHVAALKLAMSATPAMANHTLSFLSVVMSYAVEDQLIDSNPCIGVKPYTLAKRSRYLTDDEFAAIRSHAKPVLQAVMDLCYLTGQRVGDVLRIHHRDIREEGLYFKAQKTSASTQIQFVVCWTPELLAVVERAKAAKTGVVSLTLLVGAHRKPLTYRTVIGYWWDACQKAGVEDAHIHDIRAKSATDAKGQGLDAQALLGHGSAKMTERYLRLRETPVVRGPSTKRCNSCSGPIALPET